MPDIILTVQKANFNSFRFGINLNDSLCYFTNRGRIVRIIINNDLVLLTKTTCGPPLRKGFDLYSRELSNWIVINDFHNYPYGNPTKILFHLDINSNEIELTFIHVIV